MSADIAGKKADGKRRDPVQIFINAFASLMAAGFLVSILTFGGPSLPFEPVDVEGVAIAPAEMCPGEAVEVSLDGRVESGPHVVDSINGTVFWVAVDPEGRARGTYDPTPINVENVEDGEYRGAGVNLIDRAPVRAGSWTMGVDATVKGRYFGVLGTNQSVESNNFGNQVQVLPADSPECSDGEAGERER